jgi:hypothetical protein
MMLRSDWSPERIARLGFLIGLGWSAERIATDPIIHSTANNVHRQAHRFGLSFRNGAALRKGAAFQIAAVKRGIDSEELVSRLLQEIDASPTLIDNILDDDADLRVMPESTMSNPAQ